MPIKYYNKPEHNLIIFVHIGVVSDEEFLSFYRAYLEDSCFDKTFNLLIDLRKAESRVRSAEVLKELADLVRSYAPSPASTLPKAAVIAPIAVSFGLARMYQAYHDLAPVDYTVFRAVDAALAWLGTPEDLMDNLNDATRM